MTSPDGRSVACDQRSRARIHKFLWRSIRLNLELALGWKRLAEQYSKGAPMITSAEQWRKTFDSVQN